MNTYKKFCANVFVARCEQEYKKGDVITVTTKYRKENEHVIHNLVGKGNGIFFYSITRVDGYDSQERAKNKVDKLNGYADSAEKRSDSYFEKSNEGKDFLSLGEPIKVGHHSEKRHRALFERNNNRMHKAFEEKEKADAYRDRTSYWESMAAKIDLSMPDSLVFYKLQLEEAKHYHRGLKDGSIPREHSYSLTYAKNKVNELEQKYATAVVLWGEMEAEG